MMEEKKEVKKNPDGGEPSGKDSPILTEFDALSAKVRQQVKDEEDAKKAKKAQRKNPGQSLKSVGVGSLPEKKRHRKTDKLIELGRYLLLQTKGSYEDHIRAHRIVYDCDPDTEDVGNDFPFDDYE